MPRAFILRMTITCACSMGFVMVCYILEDFKKRLIVILSFLGSIRHLLRSYGITIRLRSSLFQITGDANLISSVCLVISCLRVLIFASKNKFRVLCKSERFEFFLYIDTKNVVVVTLLLKLKLNEFFSYELFCQVFIIDTHFEEMY